jgi:hypothetical protein
MKDAINKLLGVSGLYLCTFDAYGGCITLGVADVLEAVADKDTTKAIARNHGVSVADYQGWLDEDRRIRCSAITRKGTRCQSHAEHMKEEVDPEVWAEHKGEYCGRHSG